MKRFNRNNTKREKSKQQHNNAQTVNKRDEGGIYLGRGQIDGTKIKINKQEGKARNTQNHNNERKIMKKDDQRRHFESSSIVKIISV